MARADRLLRLAQALRRLPPPVTAARLAEELEVSVRTVHRDVDALRAAGATIDGAAGWGFVLVEDAALPPVRLTAEEAEAVAAGLNALRFRADAALARAAEDALAKIAAVSPAAADVLRAPVSLTHSMTDRPAPGVDPGTLRRAAREERALRLAYRDAEGRETERTVWPLAVAHLDAVDTLLAHCRLRMDFRTFRLDRIAAAEATAESFRPRRAALLREHLDRLRRAGAARVSP